MNKILSILVFLLLSGLIYAQPIHNSLSEEEYSEIRVNGVLLSEVKSTYGDPTQMLKLFGDGEVDIFGKEIGEENRNFKFPNGVEISFGDYNVDYTKPNIHYFKTHKIFIKNTDLIIGDSITKLGDDILFNTDKNGDLSLMFIQGNGDCCPIIIDFDQNSKLITSIEYFVWT